MTRYNKNKGELGASVNDKDWGEWPAVRNKNKGEHHINTNDRRVYRLVTDQSLTNLQEGASFKMLLKLKIYIKYFS